MILLARHGQTEDNVAPARVQGWRDPPLNERGIAQAKQLGGRLQGAGVKAIYSSHLSRAFQTATIIGQILCLDCNVDERLAESRRGVWEGRLISEIEASEPELWNAYRQACESFRFPGGESLEEHCERVSAAVSDIRQGPLPALVVCHGGTMRCALATYHKRSCSYAELEIPNASLVPLK